MPLKIVVADGDENKVKLPTFVSSEWEKSDMFWFADEVYMVGDEEDDGTVCMCLNDGVLVRFNDGKVGVDKPTVHKDFSGIEDAELRIPASKSS